jgi:ATP synthase protein I
MTEPSDSDRLRELERKLAAKRPPPEIDTRAESYSQASLAWRMVIEMVAGVGIGFGIGYGIDWLLGTQPWAMLVFTLLGFAAGVKTMIASAREVQAAAEAREAMAGIDPAAMLEHPGAGAETMRTGALAPMRDTGGAAAKDEGSDGRDRG